MYPIHYTSTKIDKQIQNSRYPYNTILKRQLSIKKCPAIMLLDIDKTPSNDMKYIDTAL